MIVEDAMANAEKCLESFEVRDIIKQQQETINRQKAEIERLNKQLVFEIKSAYDRGTKAAVKEFAKLMIDKSKNEFVYISDIADYALEMAGEIE